MLPEPRARPPGVQPFLGQVGGRGRSLLGQALPPLGRREARRIDDGVERPPRGMHGIDHDRVADRLARIRDQRATVRRPVEVAPSPWLAAASFASGYLARTSRGSGPTDRTVPS